MKWPVGTKFNNWGMYKETQKGATKWVVRRWAHLPDGTKKLERLPVAQFEHIRDNPEKLKALVTRLNDRMTEEEKAKAEVKLKHAYLPPAVLEEYLQSLLVSIPNARNARCEFGYLKRHFLAFFATKLNIRDPAKWKIEEDKWARALLNNYENGTERAKYAILPEGKQLSAKVLRTTVNQANRFMDFLHTKYPWK
jgi:hypothetical protein